MRVDDEEYSNKHLEYNERVFYNKGKGLEGVCMVSVVRENSSDTYGGGLLDMRNDVVFKSFFGDPRIIGCCSIS